MKKQDQEVADPGKGVIREVKEETNLDIEVVKLLAIDTDWSTQEMNFYFECALRHGYPDLSARLPSPEVKRIDWFRISELPHDMYRPHRRFLTNVLRGIPRLPGVSWSANEEPPQWWERYANAEKIEFELSNSTVDPRLSAATLVDQARQVLNCEVVSLFATDSPIHLVSTQYELPDDVTGSLYLVAESSKRSGTLENPVPLNLPLSQPQGKQLGLTVGLLREQPLGRAVRLHDDWLHKHRHVKSWTGHLHLEGGTCESMVGVAVTAQNQVLGLLKAENKMQHSGSVLHRFMPFGPDDGYILEEFARAAASLLERMSGH